jgi:hypothetical protein
MINKNIWETLQEQKAAVQAKIGTSGDDDETLRGLMSWLQREMDCKAKYNALVSEAEQLVAERSAHVVEPPSAQPKVSQKETGASTWTFADLPKSERGRVARLAFFNHQKKKGKTYTKVGRIYYKNSEGTVQGITFSSYNESNGTWFLNLKVDGFQDAILLCQTGPRSIRAVYLSKTIFQKYGNQMSRDHKGMVKFNIRREGEKFMLDVPQPVGPVDITAYADPEVLDCQRIEFK